MYKQLIVKQRFEMGEMFGFETRNKYEILDPQGVQIAFAAEQSKSILNFLFRQFMGHWRKFDVNFYTPQRSLFLIASHPFRWFFERIEVRDATGVYLGAIQKRWSIFSKKFDIENEAGDVILAVSSPIWKIWSFSFRKDGVEQASVKKKWSGVLFEAFTDKDSFLVEYKDQNLNEPARKIILASAIFIDLMYFEHKA